MPTEIDKVPKLNSKLGHDMTFVSFYRFWVVWVARLRYDEKWLVDQCAA